MAFNFTPQSIEANAVLGIDLLTNNLSRDVVGIFNQDTLEQVFTDARPMRADVRESSKVMDHPVETGVTLSDHHVILPNNIDINLLIKSQFYSSTYQQIRGAFYNATLLSVQTKAGVYQNMIIQELPHKEDPDMFDVIVMLLRMREVQFALPATITQGQGSIVFAPSDPMKANTVKRGLQNPVPTPTAILATGNTYPSSGGGGW